jgi:hypothetical protein
MTYKCRLSIALRKQRRAERNRFFDEGHVARAESQDAIR